MYFLGHSSTSTGYLCLDPISNNLYASRHVLFNETKFPFPNLVSSSQLSTSPSSHSLWFSNLLYFRSLNQPSLLGPLPSSHPMSNHSTLPNSPPTTQSLPTVLFQSLIPPIQLLSPLHLLHLYLVKILLLNLYSLFLSTNILCKQDPKVAFLNPSFATKLLNSSLLNLLTIDSLLYPNWCKAMDAEFDALQKQKTWVLIPLPPNVNLVGCKWVYKLKLPSDGSIATTGPSL